MRIIEVTSLDAPELDAYARLTEAQLRNRLEPEKGIFIAESPKVIGRALDAGMQPLSMLMDRSHLGECASLVERCGDIPVYTGPADVLEGLTGFRLTRGVLAPCVVRSCLRSKTCSPTLDASPYSRVSSTIPTWARYFVPLPHLTSTPVLVTPTCCDPLYRRAVRVSMGTVFQIPWTRIGHDPDDWPQAGIERLHELGFKTAAFALDDDSVSLDDAGLNAEDRLALVFGTEGDGLTSSTIARCDYTVRIPMAHGVDSLNVAAASAVAFWQLCR